MTKDLTLFITLMGTAVVFFHPFTGNCSRKQFLDRKADPFIKPLQEITLPWQLQKLIIHK